MCTEEGKEQGYTVERYETTVPVKEYVEQCVDVAAFLECCRQCGNYDQTWACPSFDFDVIQYWEKYRSFHIIGLKLRLSEKLRQKTLTEKEQEEVISRILWKEKAKLSEELFAEEKKYPGSISLSAGSCQNCRKGTCTRLEGKPCRFPEKMRYSIEALGGNVGLTVTKYLKQELEWIQEGRLPEHFMLVSGLLLP